MRAQLVLAALATLLALPLLAGGAAAQRSPDEAGRISGRVTNGTAGATLTGAVTVELITLLDGDGVSSRETLVANGLYEFTLRPTALESHVLRTVYRGVQYLSGVVVLSPELPEGEQDFVVYETTTEQPRLTIELTVMTVIELDRAQARLRLARQDLVNNPGDRVYVGDETGVTLRIPTPEGTIEANGEADQGEFILEGGRLAATMPLHPGVNSVVTQYLVGYDRDHDSYRARATAPLPGERMELRVPERFVRGARPDSNGRRAGDIEIGGERVMVFERTAPALPGEGLIVELEGLSGENASNPLTDRNGAIVGSMLALLVLAVAAVAIARSPLASRIVRDTDAGDAAKGER